MSELKRFGSEPDLRYSPNEHSQQHQHHHHHQDTRHSGYYPERESRERESRYRGKKKYKAPAPPTNGDGSSPDSYKWELGQERDGCCRPEDDGVQPPPRRSRLFKTRAETKKAQSNWTSVPLSQQENESLLDSERRWRNEKSNGIKENRTIWRENPEQERWSRDDRRRSKKFDGKNTLQRSLSSPEFQAELMQVARKVRNKLNYNRRVGPVGAATIISSDPKNESHQIIKTVSTSDLQRDDRCVRKSDRRIEKRKPRSLEEPFEGRREDIRSSARFHEERKSQNCQRGERISRSQDIRAYDGSPRESSRTRERLEERPQDVGPGHRRRVVEKSYVYEERITSNVTTEVVSGRKSLNERLEILGHSLDERLASDRHRRDLEGRNNIERLRESAGMRNRKSEEVGDVGEVARTRSESPAVRNGKDRTDVRGQGSGRESTPELPRGKDKKAGDLRKRRSEIKDDSFVGNEKKWTDNQAGKKNAAEKLENKSGEKTGGKTENKETQGKNWNG